MDSNKDVQVVDLRETKLLGKKTKKSYDLSDNEIKVINIDGDIVIKLISNNKGVFVDLRKYYKGYPTKKGIRIYARTYQEISQILEGDINKLIPDK